MLCVVFKATVLVDVVDNSGDGFMVFPSFVVRVWSSGDRLCCEK